MKITLNPQQQAMLREAQLKLQQAKWAQDLVLAGILAAAGYGKADITGGSADAGYLEIEHDGPTDA